MTPALEINQVHTFKLNNGEELVAKLVNKFADHVEISKPITMVLGPQGLQMIPTLFSSNPDKNVLLNTNSIAMSSEPRPDVRDKYIEATTGIQTTSKQIITG